MRRMAVIYRWTSLFRAYDLSLKSNRLILLLSAIGSAIGFAFGLFSSPDVWPAFGWAVVGGLTPFAAAALAKEIDPDHPGSAVLAAALGLPAVWLAPAESLLPLLWLLMLLRFVNRSTGLAPKATDTLVVALLAGWLVWIGSPLFGVLTGAVFIIDAVLPGGRRAHGALGAAVIVAAVAYWIANAYRFAPTPAPTWLVVALLTLTMALFGFILACYVILSPGDATGRPLDPARIQATQVMALSVGLSFASWHGLTGAVLFVALWAALLGTLLVHWLIAARRRSVVPL